MGSDYPSQALQDIPEALHETVETGWNSLMALEDTGWQDWFQQRRDQLVGALSLLLFIRHRLPPPRTQLRTTRRRRARGRWPTA